MSQDSNRTGGTRRRNSVAPNPWRRGRRRPQPYENGGTCDAGNGPARHASGLPMLAGLFADASRAERAHEALFQRGYRQDDVVVVMAETKWQKLFGSVGAAAAHAHKEADSERADAETPGAATPRPEPDPRAGTAARPLAITSNFFTTRVMAAGRIASVLAKASRPAHGDALVRALVDCGIPERDASSCAEGVAAGKILLGVVPHSPDDAKALGDEWLRESGEVIGKR